MIAFIIGLVVGTFLGYIACALLSDHRMESVIEEYHRARIGAIREAMKEKNNVDRREKA